MAEALVRGLLAKGLYRPEAILVADPLEARRGYLAAEFGVRTSGKNAEALGAPVVLLAVKPTNMAEVLGVLGPQWPEGAVLVSILAGKALADLQAFLPEGAAVARVMPNTPALIGQGMAAVACNASTTPEQKATVMALFEAVGEAVELPEAYFDAVTGLSGSGPAYVFLIVEALIEAGVFQGLPRRVARQLVLQTVLGATAMVKATGQHPAELKEQVTSPGGTTAAGLQVFESAAMRAIFTQAVKAATQRSEELSGAKPRLSPS